MPPFTVEPKSGSAINTPPQTSSRERAIAAALGKNSPSNAIEQPPVQDASRVSPEELSVVQPPSNPSKDELSTQSGQIDKVVEETAKQESSKEEPKSEEDTDKPLSAQYAQLARKEKALRGKMQEMKAKEAAIQQKEEAIKARESELNNVSSMKDRLASDPITVLNELGISWDQLTNLALNQPSPQESAQKQVINELKSEIQKLKTSQDEAKQSSQDLQRKQYDQAVNQIRSEAKALVSSDLNFETIKETDSVEDVVELIKQTFDSEGILLTVEEAAKAVEDHLVEEAMKIAKLKKIQQRLQPSKPAQDPLPKSPEAAPQKQLQTPKTLTNAIGSSRQLTARERAILAFKGERK